SSAVWWRPERFHSSCHLPSMVAGSYFSVRSFATATALASFAIFRRTNKTPSAPVKGTEGDFRGTTPVERRPVFANQYGRCGAHTCVVRAPEETAASSARTLSAVELAGFEPATPTLPV